MFSFVLNLKLSLMEEFRINNYIVDYETEPYYFKIEEIKRNEQGILACYYRNGSCWSIAPDKVELTEEILLKCGIEEAWRDDDFIRYDFEPYRFGYFDFQNGKIRVTFQGQQIAEEVEFLHQLQNLIHSLTNEELTINL